MLFIERLKAEQTNLSGNIVLYEDGSIFIKAYERSAFMFCKIIKSVIPLVYNNKKLGGQYISIGLPKVQLEKFTALEGYVYKRYEIDNVIIHSLLRNDSLIFPEKDYEYWKNKIITEKNEKKNTSKKGLDNIGCLKTNGKNHSNSENLSLETRRRLVIADIMQQSLVDFTPMRALTYLNLLQERIRNEGISE